MDEIAQLIIPRCSPNLMATKKDYPREIIELLRRMWLIRAFEEKVSALYAERQIVGLLHLGIGQEAVAVGALSLLRDDDYVYGGHRSHGHAIAKGADINKLMAEIAGRATGYCGGKGGSMHIVAKECGFITATGVVGGTIPLALGAAFAAKERKQGQIAVVFFGDGAGQSGPFHESLNIASLWRLPVIFICENNGYAEFTPLSAHTKIKQLAQHAKIYGIPNSTVDGNDLFAVRAAMTKAVDKCRAGKGPIFIECLTHRMRGHYEGDPAKYRELSQLAEWKKKDPIARVARALKSQKALTDKDLAAMESEAQSLAEKAAEFSLASPWPADDQVASQVTSD
jgi:acetoin:2,6-dichlorophenolindophenol oxidoreductase subunit alpha